MIEPKGRAKGGYARAAKLSPERRKEISKQAIAARWATPRVPKSKPNAILVAPNQFVCDCGYCDSSISKKTSQKANKPIKENHMSEAKKEFEKEFKDIMAKVIAEATNKIKPPEPDCKCTLRVTLENFENGQVRMEFDAFDRKMPMKEVIELLEQAKKRVLVKTLLELIGEVTDDKA